MKYLVLVLLAPLAHDTAALLVARSCVSMGWSSPKWNWGSAVGEAHDVAMRVRSLLSTPEVRQGFLQKTASGEVDFEEAKMALALKCQRARNLGYDLIGEQWRGNSWETLMDEMAACKFEGEGGEELLADAIRLRLPPVSQYPGSDTRTMIAVALQSLDFVARGL